MKLFAITFTLFILAAIFTIGTCILGVVCDWNPTSGRAHTALKVGILSVGATAVLCIVQLMVMLFRQV